MTGKILCHDASITTEPRKTKSGFAGRYLIPGLEPAPTDQALAGIACRFRSIYKAVPESSPEHWPTGPGIAIIFIRFPPDRRPCQNLFSNPFAKRAVKSQVKEKAEKALEGARETIHEATEPAKKKLEQ
ncbi:MAG: hypothetical protein P8X48_03390 [Acidiferrobacteraceae bacterium]